MEIVFLRSMGVALLALLAGNAPLDVAPPVPVMAGLALGVIVVLGILLVAFVLAAIFVIRRIKKHRANRDRS
jgi:uncharacterized membrane protein (DUF485 family)